MRGHDHTVPTRAACRAAHHGRARGRARLAVSALLAAVTLLWAGAGTAHAEGYRYWAFWTKDADGWTYATRGPAQLRPEDGQVLGFRFGVGDDTGDSPRPRSDATFAEICDDGPAASGRKRLALVLDFGTAAHAPPGETPPRPRTVCAEVAEDATAADALAAEAQPLRYDSHALLCAIAGYPRAGCADQVSDQAPDQQREDGARAAEDGAAGADPGGPSLGLLGSATALALLTLAALWQIRRRRG